MNELSRGGPSITTRPMLQQMCEKVWTLPLVLHYLNDALGTVQFNQYFTLTIRAFTRMLMTEVRLWNKNRIMGKQVAVVLYVVAMAALIVGVDFMFF